MKVEFKQSVGKAPIGIEDGEHIYLDCSACRAILVDVHFTQPNAIDPATNKPFEWTFKANCPFCGDKAYPKKGYGVFHIGGYGLQKPDDESEDIPSTSIELDADSENNGVITVKVLKAKPDAKPIKRT